jgi:hypothetical protein
MKRNLGLLFWAEAALASVTGFLFVLTLVWDDWIEGIFGYDPDQHNGSFEWELVVVCGVVTVLASVLARRQWTRAITTVG